MANLWTRKPIGALEAEAQEQDVQALSAHNGVPLQQILSAINLVARGSGPSSAPAFSFRPDMRRQPMPVPRLSFHSS